MWLRCHQVKKPLVEIDINNDNYNFFAAESKQKKIHFVAQDENGVINKSPVSGAY